MILSESAKWVLTLALATLSACSSYQNNPCTGTEVVSERLFLQQVSSTQAIIKWRGAADSVCVGTNSRALITRIFAQNTAAGHKEALLTGLQPDTAYFYSVGGASNATASQQFRTAPKPGQLPEDGNVKLWIVGDSGTASEYDKQGKPAHPGEAKAVMDGFLAYNAANGGEPIDLFLMLGDNAYYSGTDPEYQEAVFEVYPGILKQAALWPTIGNHEMGVGTTEYGGRNVSYPGISVSTDAGSYSDGIEATTETGMPYLDIFTLPSKAEVGGIASGTEQYYSFNYGNVHVVSLDSQLTARDDTARAAMKDWLIQDLSNNQSSWTIVIFHHPPYSKGKNHDSDKAETAPGGIDLPQFLMRDEFTPVFDQYGVDLVYSGHAHSYERSYYITNHTGTSETFDPLKHAELDKENQPASGQGEEVYPQISATSGVDDKAVYTVAGSSGKADAFPGAQHPAHFIGLGVLGSVVVDASEASLTARFIDAKGKELDHVIITR